MTQAVSNAIDAVRREAAAEETIDIPPEVLVHCPLVEYRLRPVARHCPDCPHFRGLADRLPGSSQRFGVRYLVRCQGEIKQRPLQEIDA